jgi:hypothetical protein
MKPSLSIGPAWYVAVMGLLGTISRAFWVISKSHNIFTSVRDDFASASGEDNGVAPPTRDNPHTSFVWDRPAENLHQEPEG